MPRGVYKRSEAAKQKIREFRTGKKHSEESKQKIRESRIGKKHSEETLAKMSAAQTGRKQPKSQRLKRIETRRNNGRVWHTEETKQKIGEANKRLIELRKESKIKLQERLVQIEAAEQELEERRKQFTETKKHKPSTVVRSKSEQEQLYEQLEAEFGNIDLEDW